MEFPIFLMYTGPVDLKYVLLHKQFKKFIDYSDVMLNAYFKMKL